MIESEPIGFICPDRWFMVKTGACNNLIAGFGTLNRLIVSVIDNAYNNQFSKDNCWYFGHSTDSLLPKRYNQSMLQNAINTVPIQYYLGHTAFNLTAPQIGYELKGLYYINDWFCQESSDHQSLFHGEGFQKRKRKRVKQYQWKYHLIHDDIFARLPVEYKENIKSKAAQLLLMKEEEIKLKYFQ